MCFGVLSRVLESHEDILKQSVKKHFEELLRETMPKERTSAFTQGMIEIGAICLCAERKAQMRGVSAGILMSGGTSRLTGFDPL